MEYRQVEAFTKVIRLGSMTKAAEKLNITQSTVSYRLKTLEEELGVTLIIRHKGRQEVVLTQVGELFFPLAEEWLEVNKKIQDLCRKKESLIIRIITPGSLYEKLRESIRYIREDNPSIRLAIQTGNSDQISDIISKKDADIGISYYHKQTPGTKAIKIGNASFIILEKAPKRESYPYIDPKKLDLKRAVLLKGIGTDNPTTMKYLQEHFGNVVPQISQYDNSTLLRDNMEEGEWTLITDAGDGKFSEEGGFCKYMAPGENATIPYYLIIREDADSSIRSIAEDYLIE